MDGLRWLVLAEGEAPAPPAGSGLESLMAMAPILFMVMIFYLLIIRPQQREQAKRQAELSQLKKDDEVVTIGGMFGTVANMSDDGKEITLKIADNTRVRVLRSAIQSRISPKAESEKPRA